jgi:hypothetical protein
MVLLEHNTALYEGRAGYADRAHRAYSELVEAMAATRSALDEAQQLIADANAVLARSRVLIAAQDFPVPRFTTSNTPGRTQREIDELNRRFAASMRKLSSHNRAALAEWIAGHIVVYSKLI